MLSQATGHVVKHSKAVGLAEGDMAVINAGFCLGVIAHESRPQVVHKAPISSSVMVPQFQETLCRIVGGVGFHLWCRWFLHSVVHCREILYDHAKSVL